METIPVPELKKHISPADKKKAEKIRDAGGKLYIVGGFIRDLLLELKPGDKDYCITGLKPEKVEELFPEAELVGKSFPVYLIHGKEFALARKEISTGKRHKDFKVDYSPDITIQEDLIRRDLTINAIALDILKNKIITVPGALSDLEKGKLREVSDKYAEDPLRVYRTARFAAVLDFKLTSSLLNQMQKLKPALKYLPVERVFTEFKKALASSHPQKFFLVLKKTDLLKIHFQELDNLWYVTQNKKYHPEDYVHQHILQCLQLLEEYRGGLPFRFAVLMHDVGKGLTPEENLPQHYQHDKYGVKALNDMAARLKIPNKWYQAAKIAIEEHLRITKWKEMSPGKVVKLFKKIKRSPLSIEDMVNLVKIDRRSRGQKTPLDQNIKRMKGIEELYYRMFAETGGKDINADKYSGKEFGKKLFQYRSRWLKRERQQYL
ncbi:MAG: HD domain-containing protein [Halanaerobiales bacterium]